MDKKQSNLQGYVSELRRVLVELRSEVPRQDAVTSAEIRSIKEDRKSVTAPTRTLNAVNTSREGE